MHPSDGINAKTFHQIMQPLNIIRLSCGNIHARLSNYSGEDAQYLIKGIGRIEEQVIRATQLLQELEKRDAERGLRGDDELEF